MKINLNQTVAGYKIWEKAPGPVPEMAELSRRVAADGAVLLKNENRVLPLAEGTKVSIFGRIQLHYYKSGTGSGGMVHVDHVTGIVDGLRANPKVKVNEDLVQVYEQFVAENPFDKGVGWGNEPWCQKEMPLTAEVAQQAAAVSDVAVVIIGRSAGEDHDNSDQPGSYALTETEEEMLRQVSEAFDRVVVVLNVGNIIDLSFMDRYSVQSVLYAWQGGMEGGAAVADLLCGDVTPSGKLADTQSLALADYPSSANFGSKEENFYVEDVYVGYRYFETFARDRVRYPFGYGLSYTEFSVDFTNVAVVDDRIVAQVHVKNIGEYSGREVVQLYYGAPCGKLGTPAKQLATYAKTRVLACGESQELELSFAIRDMASFDDGGYTGNAFCYVMEAGDYVIYGGCDSRSAAAVFTYSLGELRVTRRLEEAMAPVKPFDRIYAVEDGEQGRKPAMQPVPLRTVDLQDRIESRRPADIPYTGDRGIRLVDVAQGKAKLDDFVAQMSDGDLATIVCGEGMSSPKVTAGTGGAFGGVSDSLLDLGIPVACVSDGPSGLRLDSGAQATSVPIGTLLACTWDDQLVEELFEMEGIELFCYGVDALLGPGMNIHRHPLNGRNFEYFSEDPVLTGRMGAAITRGIAKTGCTSTIKHLCANNQEVGRTVADSVISQRALREIYLRGYEIAVKEGGARSVMTSYNPTNGFWCASNYDLCTTILRGEWGFDGFVMSDWWAKSNCEGEVGANTNLKAMVRAQNDIYMVCKDVESHPHNILQGLSEGFITRGELQRCAKNLLRYIMESPTFARFVRGGCVRPVFAELDDSTMNQYACFEAVVSEQKLKVELTENREYLLLFRVSSDASELSQTPVTVKIDGKEAATFSVSGTGGKEIVIKRMISMGIGSHTVICTFGSFVKMHRFFIKA